MMNDIDRLSIAFVLSKINFIFGKLGSKRNFTPKILIFLIDRRNLMKLSDKVSCIVDQKFRTDSNRL